MQAIILSGGKGTRLYPLTKYSPKPMLLINNKPHLEYQIELLRKNNITDIIFSTGYLHEQIEEYFGDGRYHGVKIQYKEDGDEPLGTGGAIKNCEDLITSENVLVLNGDVLTNINIAKMKKAFYNEKVPVMMALTPVSDPTQYGVAKVMNGRIKEFIEKPPNDSYGNLINAGVYMISEQVIYYMMDEGFSMIEQTIFPLYANANMLGAYIDDYYWLDIGTHDRFQQAQKDSKSFF
jgi:NDP-sugar pyrophosphorylase family protein